MTPEEIRKYPPEILTADQREFYFENGYLLVESIVPECTVNKLKRITQAAVEKSRNIRESDSVFDLEIGHSSDAPRLRRLSAPDAYASEYWEFASNSVITKIAADLVGGNVKFHHSKLNFKWSKGGEEVKWHQDIQYWPHTNYTPLTIGLYLDSVGPDQGPLGVIPESHEGKLFDLYNKKGEWTGNLSDEDLTEIDLKTVQYLKGPAGSVTIHNCRTIHGSEPNHSVEGRPLLLNVFSAADSFAYTYNPLGTVNSGRVVYGQPARFAHIDARPCQLPPDWSGGYSSIFALQQGEKEVSKA